MLNWINTKTTNNNQDNEDESQELSPRSKPPITPNNPQVAKKQSPQLHSKSLKQPSLYPSIP